MAIYAYAKKLQTVIPLPFKILSKPPQIKKVPPSTVLKSLPDALAAILNPLITDSQAKKALRMHNAKVKIPDHLLNIDPLTVVPDKGAHPCLSYALRKKGGRNHHGKITVRHRGGGFKRRIRIIDTIRNTPANVKSTVIRIEHDPNRSSKIALIRNHESNRLSYVLAWTGCKEGDVFQNDPTYQNPGATLPLSTIALGSEIHNIEMRPGHGGQLARSAGCKAVLVGRDSEKGIAVIRMPSGKIIRINMRCSATIGVVGNREWHLRVIGKAGRMRNLGWRPSVRGVAMNAVDHPHGGGKGGRSKGNHSQSPWGKICK